uniref:Uncharacterized protein n=1 Tax=Oryzias melastigma TaxID=30732 RepID=A0A3B3DJJ2_ORYME
MLHGLKKPRFSLQTRTHVSPISTLCVQEAWSDDGEGQEMEQTKKLKDKNGCKSQL